MNVLGLLTIKSDVVYLKSNIGFTRAMQKLRESGFTAVPVVHEDGTYAGVISEGDFLWSIQDGTAVDMSDRPQKIGELLRPERSEAVTIDADIRDVIRRAVNQNFVPIVDDRNMFIGIVTRSSVIRYLLDKDLISV